MKETLIQSIEYTEKINPELTINFVKDILEKSKNGIYRVGVKIADRIIPIDIFPNVFPPKSDYSVSSRSVFEAFGDLKGMEVADIGSGSGIESIVAVLAGAKHVDASDISENAVLCSKNNIKLNNLSDKVEVYKGDMFSSLPNKKYDLIIANLPIVDYKPAQESDVTGALYDAGLILHKRLFTEAKGYIKENGIVTFSHCNLQSKNTENPDKDFEVLEALIKENGLEVVGRQVSEALGYKWINYKIKYLS